MNIPRTHQLLAALAATALLSACGGGDNATTSPAAGGTGGGSVSAAPLVVSAATPVGLNGTLDKSTAVFESNSSNALMTTYNASDDHCRVGAFAVLSSNGTRYTIEISFSKTAKTVGIIKYGTDTPLAMLARSVAPVAGVTVDVANRRIGFVNTVVGVAPSTNSVTLNGSLEYPTNIDPAARAACG
jgi:hypothetical protein